jgi:hypothetical protein
LIYAHGRASVAHSAHTREGEHTASVLFVAAVGVEVGGVTHGAESREVDVRFGNAHFEELAAIGIREIDVADAGLAEFRGHFRADLITTFTDSRSDGGVQVRGIGGEFRAHTIDGVRDDGLDGAAPTGVDGGYGVMLFVHEENREAVGSFDGDEVSGGVFEERVGIAQDAGAAVRAEANGGMDLMDCGELGVVSDSGSVAGAEAVFEPGKGIEGAGAIDVLRVLVEHATRAFGSGRS